MLSFSFKNVAFYIQVLGNLICVEILVKLYLSYQKIMLERCLLSNFVTCKTFGIVPKLRCFNLPCTNNNNQKAIPQSLLRSST